MSEIDFNEEKHEYTRNGIKYISVTTLLKKYNLSANYTGISPDVMKEAAKRGKYLHGCLEDYIKHGINKDPNLIAPFVSYVNNRNIDLTLAKSEEVIYDDTYIIAGTVDFQYTDGIDQTSVIADFKGTSSIHWDSVTWQTSIYNFILSRGNQFEYYFRRLQVIHFYNGRFTVRELPTIPYEEVENLLKANMLDLPYSYTPNYNNILDISESKIYNQICNELAEYETIIQDLKAKREKLDKKIIDNLKLTKMNEFKTNDFVCKLVERNGSKVLDKDKLEKYLTTNGEDINNYYKISGNSSAYLKITKTTNKKKSSVLNDIHDITVGNVKDDTDK